MLISRASKTAKAGPDRVTPDCPHRRPDPVRGTDLLRFRRYRDRSVRAAYRWRSGQAGRRRRYRALRGQGRGPRMLQIFDHQAERLFTLTCNLPMTDANPGGTAGRSAGAWTQRFGLISSRGVLSRQSNPRPAPHLREAPLWPHATDQLDWRTGDRIAKVPTGALL